MPGEHLTAGFFGKLPATGDFVVRNLPSPFVRFWDRWAARHLAGPLAAEPMEELPALRFLLGPETAGPMAGIVMASADRAGRCFPLTLAATLPAATTAIAADEGWFADIEHAGDAARYGEIDIDGLETRLGALASPAIAGVGRTVRALALWNDATEPQEVDPDTPAATIEALLASREAS